MSDAIEQLRNFIDGRWEEAPDRMLAINPANGGQIAWLPKSDRECARKAIAAAKRAKAAWAAEPVWKRANLCVAIATKIDERRSKIAHTLSAEQGKPLAQATGEVAKAADGFRLAAELAKQMQGETLPAEDPTKLVMTLRQPRGVYAVITPWNYPVNIPVEYLGPGIATGNTIVWIPAPTTSMAAVALMRAIEAARAAERGPQSRDRRRVRSSGTRSFPTPTRTASASPAARDRAAHRGARRGKTDAARARRQRPSLVFEDADLKRAAKAAANGAFSNAGQICAATGRVLAHRERRRELRRARRAPC